MAYLLVELLELNAHANASLDKFTHVVIQDWKVQQVGAEMSQDTRVEIVLNIVLPVLLCVIDAKYCLLTVGQEWRLIVVCVVYGCGVLGCSLVLHVMRNIERCVAILCVIGANSGVRRHRLRY